MPELNEREGKQLNIHISFHFTFPGLLRAILLRFSWIKTHMEASWSLPNKQKDLMTLLRLKGIQRRGFLPSVTK